MKSHTLVLLSGGIDSMATTHFYKELGHEVQGLFVDYGQLSNTQEKKSAQRLAKEFEIKLHNIKIPPLNKSTKHTGFIQGRNLMLISLGISSYTGAKGSISIGIHKGSGYSDCTPNFIKICQNACDIYYEGRVTIGSPFLYWDKITIYKYCKENKLPISMTYSCERGNSNQCGKCSSCKDRELLNDC